MTLHLIRTQHGFMPAFDDDVNAAKKVPIGEMIATEWKPARNPKFHRKLFALLNAVLPNQDKYKTIDHLRKQIIYQSGYYESLKVFKNGEEYEVISINSMSFSEMDEIEYNKVYSTAIDVCIELLDEESINDILRFI